jgi:Na+/melibiose symporter-like transporter
MSDKMPAGGELTAAERTWGQRAALRANLFMNCVNIIVTGSVMMLYATDVLGFSGKKIATILALAPLAALLRIPLLRHAARLGLGSTLRISATVNVAITLALAVLPARWVSYPAYLGLLILFSSMVQLGWGMAWQPLLRGITTHDDRGRFFARMRFAFSIVTTLVTLSIPLLVGEQMNEGQYKLLLALAALGELNFLFWVGRIPEVPRSLADKSIGRPEPGLRLIWHVLRTAPVLRIPLLIHILLALGAMPLFVVYLRQFLGYPTNVVSMFIFVVTAASTLSLLFWGRVADTVGFRPMLVGILLVGMVSTPLLLLLAPASPSAVGWGGVGWLSVGVLLFHALLGGALGAGSGIATTTIQHYHVRQEDSVEAMNLFSLILVAFTSLNSLWAGFLLDNVAMASGSVAFARGWCHFDWVKGFLLAATFILNGLALLLTLRLTNMRPYFGLGGFFSSLTPDAMRTIFIERHIYHDSEEKRTETARWMGAHSGPLTIAPLTEMLTDPAYDVKVEAIRALARTGSPMAGERLLTLLNSEASRQLADHAAWALGELQYQPAFDALLHRLASDHAPRIRAMCARTLGKLGDRRAAPAIAAALAAEHESQHVMTSACWALLRLGAIEDYAELIFNTLQNLPDREERYELMDALCDPLGLSHEWLLRFTNASIPFQALQQYIAHQPPAWREARASLVAAFHARDLAAIRTALRAAVSQPPETEDPLLQSFAAALERFDRWQSPAVLASAWLLLRKNGAALDDGSRE